MFLRCKVRRKDGKQHRYWSVVENTRVAGRHVNPDRRESGGIRERRILELMPANGRRFVLTKDILFGMIVLSLAGFLVMGLSLTLHRTGTAGTPLSIELMCAGTALVFFGLFSAGLSN
jgi:hypothetical protein